MVVLLVEQTKMTMLTMIKVMIMTTTIMKELKTFHKQLRGMLSEIVNCDFSITPDDEGNSSSPEGVKVVILMLLLNLNHAHQMNTK